MAEYKFDSISCSSCGGSFGPGDCGFSDCRDHRIVRIKYSAKTITGRYILTDPMHLRDAEAIIQLDPTTEAEIVGQNY